MISFLIAGMIFGVLVSFGYRLTPLLLSPRRVTLAFSPASLRMGEIVLAIMAMVMKSIFYAIPGIPRIRLSGLELDAPFNVDVEDIARYQLAIGQESSSETEMLPTELMLFLSSITEPAMLLLLASPWCPINPLGAVNVRNRFEVLRLDLRDPSTLMDLRSACLHAVVHKDPRQTKRGMEWDLEVMINVPTGRNDRTVEIIFRQTFTMLEFSRVQNKKTPTHSDVTATSIGTIQPVESTTVVSLSADDPLKWAEICKDYNFIHLSGTAAKVFGLPGKIAHGNHVIAKALWRLPDLAGSTSLLNTASWMEVQFKRPMVVPGVFGINAHKSGQTSRKVTVSHQGKDYAIAEYGSLRS
jgi:acyl dehydratase